MANFNERTNDTVEFKLVSKIGVLAEYQTGWCKELNIVAWNGGVPKYDIRDWNPEHERMTRGITMHEEEMKKLYEILKRMFENAAGSFNSVNSQAAGANTVQVETNQTAGADMARSEVTQNSNADKSDSPGELYEDVALNSGERDQSA